MVTGASGFVGSGLSRVLGAHCEPLALGGADWSQRVAEVNWRDATVFHLAARVHAHGDAEAAFQHDNVEKTETLARAAASNGARRFVFLSSIKVNGEQTTGQRFQASDPAKPEDAYARSKWRAEQAVAEVSRSAGLDHCIVRSPLVIGPGAKGNLVSLLRLADSPWPLPFAAIDNRRTFIARDDLADLLQRCGFAAEASGRTFLAGDPDSVSTPRLLTVLRRAMGRSARLFHVPVGLLEALSGAVSLGASMQRLTRSLEVDAGDAMRLLGWSPRRTMDEALAEMGRAAKGAA
ncbi:hypothetical protein BWI17_05710 [Betaproteobacteria bacterium GR16-43]|nr:hypothetical protein BWI17_05710 [Betaproteobacteria bacterium GR16-43]